MNTVYQRMQKLSKFVSTHEEVRCLLGLGSISDKERLDIYSDIDFFLIVKNGFKERFLNQLDWLEVEPITYSFKNTRDGYKVLYHDGVFAEFAVFDEDEMKTAKFTEGTVFYHKDDFDLELVVSKIDSKQKDVDVNFNINEAMTNLYVGVMRELRGEKSSAMTFIQDYAYRLVIELFPSVFEEENVSRDPFVFERRIEQRFPNQKELLASMRLGINQNKASAKNILKFLKEHFDVDQELHKHISAILLA